MSNEKSRSTEKFDELENILREIWKQHDKSLINETKKFKAIVDDLCKGELRKERKLLFVAIEEELAGIILEWDNISVAEKNIRKDRFVKNFSDERYIPINVTEALIQCVWNSFEDNTSENSDNEIKKLNDRIEELTRLLSERDGQLQSITDELKTVKNNLTVKENKLVAAQEALSSTRENLTDIKERIGQQVKSVKKELKKELREKITKVVESFRKEHGSSRFVFLPGEMLWLDKRTATLLPDIYSYVIPLVYNDRYGKHIKCSRILAGLRFEEITTYEFQSILNRDNEELFYLWISDSRDFFDGYWATEDGVLTADGRREDRGAGRYRMLLVYRLRGKNNARPLTNKECFKELLKLKLIPCDAKSVEGWIGVCKNDYYNININQLKDVFIRLLINEHFDRSCVSEAERIFYNARGFQHLPVGSPVVAFMVLKKVLQQLIDRGHSPKGSLALVLRAFLPLVKNNESRFFADFCRWLKEKGFNVPTTLAVKEGGILKEETVRLYREVMKDWEKIEPYVELNDDLSKVTIKDGIDNILIKGYSQ